MIGACVCSGGNSFPLKKCKTVLQCCLSSATRFRNHKCLVQAYWAVHLESDHEATVVWVAVTELNLSYHFGEDRLFTIHTQYGTLIQVP